MNRKTIQKLEHTEHDIASQMNMVFQRSYQVEADLIGVEEFPPLKRTIADFQTSSTVFYGFLREGILAGIIEIDCVEDQLEICSLVVDPDFFRQGIASKLIDYVLNTYKPGLSMVETALVNAPAITLYQSKGYVEEEKWITSFGIMKIKLIRLAKRLH